MAEIKKITVGSTDYDLSAKYLQDGSGNNKSWSDITSLVETGFEIEVVTELPTITAANYDNYRNKLLLKADESAEAGTYLEYVAYKTSGATPVYGLEQIGSTQTDLSGYALKGTYTSGGPSVDATGSAGAQTATGTATISYKKAATETGEAGGGVAGENTGSAGGVTISGSNFSFTGTTVTLSQAAGTGSVKLDHHEYTPEGSIAGSQAVAAHSHGVNVATASFTYVTGVNDAASAGAHTHSLDSHEHADNVTAITALSTTSITPFGSGGSASLSTKNYGFNASVSTIMYNPTVSAAGVLSWSTANANTQPALSFTPASGGTAVTVATGARSTASAAGAASAATLVVSQAGAHTHTVGASGTATATFVTGATLATAGAFTINGSNFSFSGTAATLKHTQAKTATTDYNTLNTGVPAVSISYQPAGTIGGSQIVAAHSHTYVKPAAHTHSIALSDTEVTGTAAVAVSNHTHSLGNHTHSTTI